MIRIRTFTQKGVLLFFILFILLFLGESKQPAVDVVGAAGVLVIVLYAKYYLKKIREIPRAQAIAWAGLLCYVIVRSVFSDDIGYSVFASVRYIEAFLIYRTFYCFFDVNDVKPLVHALAGFCVVSLLTAVVFTIFPTLQGAIPRMNLLYPAYGHNHIIDILLFGFPAILFLALRTRKKLYIILTAILLIGIIFSLARAAMVLVGLYVLAIIGFFIIKKASYRTYAPLCLLFVVIALSLAAVFYVGENNILSHSVLEIRKSSVYVDTRYGYYKQAIAAISERPFFGSGPGTFYLESLRFQSWPLTYSWFAHNFYLEQLVELGVVGCAFLALVFFVVVYRPFRALNVKKDNIYSIAIAAGAGVSALYGFIDISLNFLVVWLLWWACIGLIGGTVFPTTKGGRSVLPGVLSAASCIIVLFFYCIVLSTYIFPKGFYAGFLDVYYAVDLIKNENNANVILVATTLHRRNPDVLLAAKRYKEAFYNNPQNIAVFKEYFSYLVKDNKTNELTELFGLLIRTYMADSHKSEDVYTRLKNFSAENTYSSKDVDFFGNPTNIKEGLSKMLYYFGLRMISQNPQTTRIFWESAKEITPELGHYYVELSSLYYAQNDVDAAKKILNDCEKYYYPKKQCVQTPWPPLAPGSLQEKIQAFPKIL
jgi:O-antigen ligase